jgi:hypothetical protein
VSPCYRQRGAERSRRTRRCAGCHSMSHGPHPECSTRRKESESEQERQRKTNWHFVPVALFTLQYQEAQCARKASHPALTAVRITFHSCISFVEAVYVFANVVLRGSGGWRLIVRVSVSGDSEALPPLDQQRQTERWLSCHTHEGRTQRGTRSGRCSACSGSR